MSALIFPYALEVNCLLFCHTNWNFDVFGTAAITIVLYDPILEAAKYNILKTL